MRPLSSVAQVDTSHLPVTAQLHSTSGAITGALRLKSEELDLSTRLGPEVSGTAPMPYEKNAVLAPLRMIHGGRIGDLEISARSDIAEGGSSGSAYAEVILRDLDLRVTQQLRLRAAEISTRCMVTMDPGPSSGVDCVFREATLELHGIGPVPLPSPDAPNTRVRPDLLEPIGLELILNKQVVCITANPSHHTLRVSAFQLNFQAATVGGEPMYGQLEFGATIAALDRRLLNVERRARRFAWPIRDRRRRAPRAASGAPEAARGSWRWAPQSSRFLVGRPR
jgi:hypothetical protein